MDPAKAAMVFVLALHRKDLHLQMPKASLRTIRTTLMGHHLTHSVWLSNTTISSKVASTNTSRMVIVKDRWFLRQEEARPNQALPLPKIELGLNRQLTWKGKVIIKELQIIIKITIKANRKNWHPTIL